MRGLLEITKFLKREIGIFMNELIKTRLFDTTAVMHGSIYQKDNGKAVIVKGGSGAGKSSALPIPGEEDIKRGERTGGDDEIFIKMKVVKNESTGEIRVITIVINGEDAIYDYIGEFKFRISPLSFFQVNPVQTEVLYGKALEYAGLKGDEIVFDAYCGIGTISLFLSKKAKKVYGVEIVPQAIKHAKENARLNGVANAEFIVGESERVIPDLYKRGVQADVIVVDPPRKGCDERLLEVIAQMRPERVVYVSCNPSTLARDLKYLDERGYRTVEIQPVDMFPQTVHVEAIVLMTYCGSKEKK
jgi:tRNA/tmRNA/rRNA uracil-C5-methylase (TrmA/RlmC/RlmD family)